jgi:extracellular factor (EF) 3-hydroxypalmitic acid methyl ester biosynthesis protein
MSELLIKKPAVLDRFEATLERIAGQFDAGDSSYQLMSDLFEAANAAIGPGGDHLVSELRELATEHRVARYVYQCPFTTHSRDKPRGYAGDAHLIDYIYGHRDAMGQPEQASTVGQRIMAHNLESPAAAAVRARRTIIGMKIEEAVERMRGPRILSVACGNSRELELLRPEVLESIGEFVGFDQDARSLATTESHGHGGKPIRVTQGTIVDLMRTAEPSGFDLVYAAGLFDYLSDRLCRRLTKSLVARLNSGGRLLLANFLPGIRDAGYMETFMHWTLIYRDRAQIMDFVADVVGEDIARLHYFMEPNRNIGFLEVVKA